MNQYLLYRDALNRVQELQKQAAVERLVRLNRPRLRSRLAQSLYTWAERLEPQTDPAL